MFYMPDNVVKGSTINLILNSAEYITMRPSNVLDSYQLLSTAEYI